MFVKRLVKKFLVLLFVFPFISSFVFAGEYDGLKFDEGALTRLAVDNGFGYKFANLDNLGRLTQKFNEKEKEELTYRLEVPMFIGISSGTVQKFIQEQDPEKFDVAKEWEKLINKFFPDQGIKDETLRTKKYPDGFMEAREEFEKKVAQAFDRIIAKMEPKFKLGHVLGNESIDKFITDVNEKSGQEKLMVRSTGKEDTRELANAGGNETVPNVTPSSAAILPAIKIVVVSYFGAKSLTQRLGAGDKSIFDLKPFCPVLLQWMIGEKDPAKLPKCGVMFTEEPEGGISRYEEKDEKGNIKTTGITLIQSAYGHNEGVVNSLIPVDTFYVDGNKNIYPVIRPKTHRMIPVGEGKLDLIKNENPEGQEIINATALNKDALMALKLFSNALESYYGYPMDVEFVINEENKTIYIVQARPIVHPENIPSPSYLQNIGAIPVEQKVVGSAIGVAGGALRLVTSKGEMIVSGDIGKALAEYQTVPDAKNVKAVVVGAMAPATSHEATTFRGELKPVIFISDWQTVQTWIAGTSLVIDPQQGLVVNTEALGWEEDSLEKLLVNQKAKEGWASYPIPSFGSLSPDFVPEAVLTEAAIKEFLPERIQRTGPLIPKDLIEEVKTGDRKSAEIALGKILVFLSEFIVKKGKDLLLDEDTKQRIKFLSSYALEFVKRVRGTLDFSPKDERYTQRLFAIKWLEILLYQEQSPVVDGFSLAIVGILELEKEKKILETIGKQPEDPRTIQYFRLRDLAFTTELALEWSIFIRMLDKNEDEDLKNKFAKLIFDLGKLDLLPVWLHTSFDQVFEQIKQKGFPQGWDSKIVLDLIKEFDNQSQFLKTLSEKKTEMQALNISAFDDPKNFENQWRAFNKILNYFLGKEFIDAYKAANNLGKLAAGIVMAKFVDTFDLSIKAVTGSTLYKVKVDEQLKRLHEMLLRYADLFKTWIELVPKGAIPYNPNSPLRYFVLRIDNILAKKTFTEFDLNPTPGLNVSAFTIGSGLDIRVGQPFRYPTTFEDAFTIMHQSSLVILNKLNALAGMERIKRSEFLRELEEIIISVKKKGFQFVPPSFLGIDLDVKSISLFYSLPLVQHSVKFKLTYNKKTKEILLTLDFFGHSPVRWHRIGHYAFILEKAEKIKTKKIKVTEDGVSLILIFKEKEKTYFSEIKEYIQKAVDISFGSRFNYEEIWPFVKLDEKFVLDFAKRFPEVVPEKEVRTFFERRNNLFEIIMAFSKKIDSGCQIIQKIFLILWKNLIENEKFKELRRKIEGFSNLIDAIKIKILEGEDVQREGLELFIFLVKKNLAFGPAVQIALESIKNRSLEKLTFDLWKILIEKGYGAEEATKSAVDNFKSLNLRSFALNLFKILIEKNKGIPEAIQVASEHIKKELLIPLALWRTLLENNQGFEQAIKVIIEGLQSDEKNVIYNVSYLLRSALEIFNKLDSAKLKTIAGIDELIAAAKTIDDTNIPPLTMQLITELVASLEKKLLEAE